jgi:hypothetical protein
MPGKLAFETHAGAAVRNDAVNALFLLQEVYGSLHEPS